MYDQTSRGATHANVIQNSSQPSLPMIPHAQVAFSPGMATNEEGRQTPWPQGSQFQGVGHPLGPRLAAPQGAGPSPNVGNEVPQFYHGGYPPGSAQTSTQAPPPQIWVSDEGAPQQVYSHNLCGPTMANPWVSQAMVHMTGTGASPGLTFSPAMTMIANNLKPPKLEGTNFSEFSMEFPEFLRNSVPGQEELPDNMKLALLKQSIPEGDQIQLRIREENHQRGTGPAPTYIEFWNFLCKQYTKGKDNETVINEQLRTLRPEVAGKGGNITLDSWKRYSSKFQLLLHRLEHPDLSSLVTTLQARTPHHIRPRLIAEEEKRNSKTPVVKMTGVRGIPLETIRTCVNAILRARNFQCEFRVEPRTDGFNIHVYDNRGEDVLLQFNGKDIWEGDRKLATPRFTRSAQRMDIEDIFEFVENQIRIQDRSDEVARMMGDVGLSLIKRR